MDSPICEACNKFAIRVFAHLNKSGRNILLSPWSMFNALSMIFVGSRGRTADQMSQELGLSNPESFESLLILLTQLQGVKSVKTASKMWIQSNFDILSTFEEHIKKYFLSEVGVVDYAKDSDDARLRINAWVEEQTNSKIENLIPPGVLDPSTRFVLTSAVYFKDTWLTEFPKGNTRPMEFHVNSKKSVTVDMMYLNAKKDVMYQEGENFQVLVLPYIGKKVSMCIMLPKEKVSLITIVNDMKSGKLRIDSITKPSMRLGSIEIYVPRFKFAFAETYNTILQHLGLTHMFSDEMADFSGITRELPGLKVTSVIQKAFIEVNEEGTEAAAVTAVGLCPGCIMPKLEPPIIFKADRPFIFLISEEKSNTLLFMGQVTDPSK